MLSQSAFQNVFAVANDSQIIYGLGGANYQPDQAYIAPTSGDSGHRFRRTIGANGDRGSGLNRLVVYNVQRSSQEPLVAGRQAACAPDSEQIQLRVFESEDDDEALGITRRSRKLWPSSWGTNDYSRARTSSSRSDEQRVALTQVSLQSRTTSRRLSPEFRWLVAVLRQTVEPLNQEKLVGHQFGSNQMAGTSDRRRTGGRCGFWSQLQIQLPRNVAGVLRA